MKLNAKTIKNIIFYGFIIFLFTPYGANTKVKLIQGVSYVKSLLFAPSSAAVDERKPVNTFNVQLNAIKDAKSINLRDLKGNVIFLNYWATWCPPCRAEMPSIQSLYNDYKDKIAFVFITSDSEAKVSKFYSENNYQLPTYQLGSNPPSEISTRSLPTTFILDKNGKIVLRETGASNWNSSKSRALLDKLLQE